MNSLLQLSRALNDARLEKEAAVAQAVAHAKAEKMEAAADERQEQLIKVQFRPVASVSLFSYKYHGQEMWCREHLQIRTEIILGSIIEDLRKMP